MVTNLEDVEKEVRDDAKGFSLKRHSGSKTSNLRSAIRKHLGIAQFVGDQLAKAVATSFPAASPIWTVASFAIQTAQKMSADYDKVEQLFVEAGEFLKTLKILEGRVPDNTNYVQRVTDIIESIMVVFAVHTKYMHEHRAVKFLKSLSGQDDELAGAYSNVTRALEKLSQSSTAMALRNTEDIKLFLTSEQEQVASLEQQVNDHFDVLNEKSDTILAHTTTLQDMQKESDEKSQERFEIQMRYLEKKFANVAIGGKQSQSQAKDPAARKPAALNQVKQWCALNMDGVEGDPMGLVRKFKKGIVDVKYLWFFEHDKYVSWATGRIPLLFVRGAPGVGKSILAQFVTARLASEEYALRGRSISASFYFQESKDAMRTITNCLYCLAFQIARKDSSYCEQIAGQMRDGLALYDNILRVEYLWTELFAKKFGPRSETSLYLILDGIDEIDTQELSLLLDLLTRISEEKLKIFVLITGRTDVTFDPAKLKPEEIEMAKPNMKLDLSLFAHERCHSLARIDKFTKRTKRVIETKLAKKADGMLYVDLALHHLDFIGKEPLIRKALEKLPDGLDALCEHIVSQLYESRPAEYHQPLRVLYAALVYARRPLSIGEANQLVLLSVERAMLKVEDEVQGHSSIFLEYIVNNDEESSGSEDESATDDDASAASDGNSVSGVLYFQERALRDIIRSQNFDSGRLVPRSFDAHLMMMDASISLLCTDTTLSVQYAACFWDWHFLQLEINEASEDQIIRVLVLISRLLRNENDSLAKIERSNRPNQDFGTLDERTVIRKAGFEAIIPWLERAVSCATLNADLSKWVRKFLQDPRSILVDLAQKHVENWLQAAKWTESCEAFQWASKTLTLCESLNEKPVPDLSSERIREIAGMGSAVTDSFKFHQALGWALGNNEFYQAAIGECDLALKCTLSEQDHFKVWVFRGEAGLCLPDAETDVFKQAHADILEGFSRLAIAFPEPLSDADKSLLWEGWNTRAESELKLGLYSEAIKSYEEIGKLAPEARAYILDVTTSTLERQGDFSGIITKVKEASREDRVAFFAYYGVAGHTRVQKAVSISASEAKADLLREYQELIAYLDRTKCGGSMRLRLAYFHREVLEDNAGAMTLVSEILDGDVCKHPSGSDDMDALIYARFCYSELVYEEFVSSFELSSKKKLMEGLEKLPERRLGKAFGLELERSSQTATILARLTRKMGPSEKYYNVMQETFMICYNGLSDATLNNDSDSLRLLARLLLLAGLERDARIAVSAQFSRLEDDASVGYMSEDEDDNEHRDIAIEGHDNERDGTEATTGDTKGEIEARDATQLSDLLTRNESSSQTQTTANLKKEATSTEATTTLEDLSGEEITCDGCRTSFQNWTTSPIYLCAMCASCDLCPSCREKRIAQTNGASNWTWREYCGPNHEYIMGPVEGWQGIKNGVMTIGGEKVEFREWLRQVKEERWVDVWREFWKGA
ncbi:MAG: hypothetical protein M1820_010873 [Bogoriella megaspora]|nr:MAG: hypothetical protein M1820_010873 [Bogoriella megaspora]